MDSAILPADAAAGATAVLGATSFVGGRLLARLGNAWHGSARQGGPVHAFTRGAVPASGFGPAGTTWHSLESGPPPGVHAPRVISLAPLWTLPAHFPLFEALGCRRLVALSSTSRFTKREAPARADRELAARLEAAEEGLLDWAAGRGIAPVILRPTLVYDGVHDRNVAEIARVIRRTGGFACVGRGAGLRMPLHADDLVAAVLAGAAAPAPRAAYDLSGGETLPYREMVARVFAWVGLPERIVAVPRWAAQACLAMAPEGSRAARLAAMGLRMDDDMVFDHAAAAADLGFAPRGFALPRAVAADHAGG